MSQHRLIGLERQDGFDVGRDPRTLSTDDLERVGHARVSPLRALRLKCLDCCNGAAREVRLCTAVDCPSWPFRMGKNPWAGPVSDARREHGRRLGRRRAAHLADALAEKDESDGSPSDGVTQPADNPAGLLKSEKEKSEGGQT
jgi:hypothetical protein